MSKTKRKDAELIKNISVNISEIPSHAEIEAHEFCSNHKEKLLKDNKCGCFYCMEIFNPREITEWVEDIAGTAICPYCGIDSIIGESSGYPITKIFLEKMYEHWFASTTGSTK